MTQALIGQPLGTPARRALAIGVDLAAIGLLSNVSNLWLLGGLALVLLLLRSDHGSNRWRRGVGWVFAVVMLLLATEQALMWSGHHPFQRERPAAAAEWADVASSQAEAASAVPAASAASATDAERIALLEAQVDQLKSGAVERRGFGLKRWLDEGLESVGVSFAWGIVYFSLLPALWGGQTLGKKLLGLRVVELTGQPITVMRALRRYGGYAAGMATGGLGFLQLLFDPNRQGIQDRTAHTVVLDVRRHAAVAAPTPVAADRRAA